MLQKEPSSQLSTVIKKIKDNYPQVQAIYLFGSFGTEYETRESDVDIALLLPQKGDAVSLWELAQEIAIELNRDIDLIDLRSASTVFQYQILMTGKRIFCLDNEYCDMFEMTCLSMYLRLNEERKSLIHGDCNG